MFDVVFTHITTRFFRNRQRAWGKLHFNFSQTAMPVIEHIILCTDEDLCILFKSIFVKMYLSRLIVRGYCFHPVQ